MFDKLQSFASLFPIDSKVNMPAKMFLSLLPILHVGSGSLDNRNLVLQDMGMADKNSFLDKTIKLFTSKASVMAGHA